MLIWCVPFINVVLSAWLATRAVRKKRLMSVYWCLATYFGLLLIRDMYVAPIVLGGGLIPVTVPAQRIAQLALFVLLCNVSFLAGELIGFPLAAKHGPTLPPLSRESATGKHLFLFYAALFVVGCVVFLPEGYSLNYHDMVNNVMPEWKGLLLFLGLPAISVATLQRRYVMASIGVTLCMGLVLTSYVRMFVLISAVPMLLILLFGNSASRRGSGRYATSKKPGVAAACLLLAVLGGYVTSLREGSLELPEDGLQKGMYLVCDRVDSGISGTGNASLETLAKAILYPFYNRLLTVDYSFPIDPATYIAEITIAHPPVGVGFQHYPYLWYSDVYLAAGWFGAFQGVIWGFVMALWEGVMCGRPIISAVFLPYFTLMLYMFYRGAGAQIVHIVSREIYFQITVLLVGGLYLHLVWNNRKHRPQAVSMPRFPRSRALALNAQR